MTRPLTPKHVTPARLTPTELLRRGVGWVDDYRHILGIQLKARLHPDPPPTFAEGDGVPILVLPGIYEPWHSLERIARDLNRRGHPIIVVPELGLNVAELRASARTVAQALRATGSGHLIVLAHSKGGLIGKLVMLDPDVADRVSGMVALSTPFGGSSLSWPILARSPLGLFAPRGRAITDLAAQVEVNARIIALQPSHDQVIPGGGRLTGARNVTLEAAGHFRPLRNAQVHRVIHELVHELEGTPQ